MGFIAIEAGWTVTEVGRQPWIIYGVHAHRGRGDADARAGRTRSSGSPCSTASSASSSPGCSIARSSGARGPTSGPGSMPPAGRPMPEITLADRSRRCSRSRSTPTCCSAAPTSAAACGTCSPPGPRRARQREVIAHAIGPIWEANHVWLILAIVLAFTCFSPVFARIMTVLHIPAIADAGRDRAAGLGLHLPDLRRRARRRPAPLGPDLLQRERPHPAAARRVHRRGGVRPGGRRRPKATSSSGSSSRGSRPFALSGWELLALALFAFLAAVFLTLETAETGAGRGFPAAGPRSRRRGLPRVGAGVAALVRRGARS